MGDGDSLRVLFGGEYGEEMEQRRCAGMLLGADRGRRNGACARAQGILGAVAAGWSWSSAATEGRLLVFLWKEWGRHGKESRGVELLQSMEEEKGARLGQSLPVLAPRTGGSSICAAAGKGCHGGKEELLRRTESRGKWGVGQRRVLVMGVSWPRAEKSRGAPWPWRNGDAALEGERRRAPWWPRGGAAQGPSGPGRPCWNGARPGELLPAPWREESWGLLLGHTIEPRRKGAMGAGLAPCWLLAAVAAREEEGALENGWWRLGGRCKFSKLQGEALLFIEES
jgi:hypothetical protein